MDKKTGEELVKKELLSKVDEKDDTKPLDKLPAVTAEQGVLFAKEKVENATLDGAKLKYEGNTIIGSGRAYTDMYAIVDDATYSNVKGDEKSVGVLKFDKDPSKEFPGKNGVEASQLVKLKVIKSFATFAKLSSIYEQFAPYPDYKYSTDMTYLKNMPRIFLFTSLYKMN